MPQPIDFNTEIAKISAAERAQEVMARASLAAQQRQTIAEQQTQIQTETQVIQTAQTENLAVEPEPKRRNPFVGKRRRKQTDEEPQNAEQQNKERESPPVAETEHHQLDITI